MADLTVVTTTYNSEATISKFLNNLRRNFRGQIVIVDRGSSDATLDIIRNFLDKNTKLVIAPQNSGGLEALEIASEYISTSHVFLTKTDFVLETRIDQDNLGYIEESHTGVLVPKIKRKDKLENRMINFNFEEGFNWYSLSTLSSKLNEDQDYKIHYVDEACMIMRKEIFVETLKIANKISLEGMHIALLTTLVAEKLGFNTVLSSNLMVSIESSTRVTTISPILKMKFIKLFHDEDLKNYRQHSWKHAKASARSVRLIDSIKFAGKALLSYVPFFNVWTGKRELHRYIEFSAR